MTETQIQFIDAFNAIARACHETAVEKGWWEEDRNVGEIYVNIHGEVSEGWEYYRKGNPESDHIPAFSGEEEELADIIIRIMDYAAVKGHRVPEAILAKMEYNAGREYRHGGKRA